jgi:V/A-type H+/Na+-transporting ATPase subunit K
MKRKALLLVVLLGTLFAGAGMAWADEAQQTTEPKKRDITTGIIAIAAALAVGACAIGTGMAQSRIGSAGAGTIAEKPETSGSIILLLAIPETMVILGFVVAIIMVFTM